MRTQAIDVRVAGWGARPFGRTRDGSTPRDWVRQVVRAALADAEIGSDAIDAVIVASESDFFSLQLSPAALLADEAGLVGKPVMRVEGGGASGALALRAGMLHVLSGLHRAVLVVGFEHAASHLPGDDVRLLYGLSFDADLDGMAGATTASLYALSMSLHMQAFGTTERQFAHVAARNRRNALANPFAHKGMAIGVDDVLASPVVSTPYRRLDCSLISDGAAALVLTAPGFVASSRRQAIRVCGSGCANDRVRLGDRDQPYRFASKRASGASAYAQAGVREPARDIDVAELYDAFSGAEIQGIEALGLAVEGQAAAAVEAGEFDADGRLPVNLSGGLLGQGGPPGATGVMQAITVARLLAGEYAPRLQPRRELRRGLVDAHGGCATVSVTHVLERVD
jgi:acetyl-CoA C-acetyltransferase